MECVTFALSQHNGSSITTILPLLETASASGSTYARLAIGTFSRWCLTILPNWVVQRVTGWLSGCLVTVVGGSRDGNRVNVRVCRVTVGPQLQWLWWVRVRDGGTWGNAARQRRRLRLGRRHAGPLVSAPPSARQPSSGQETSTYRYVPHYTHHSQNSRYS